MKDEPLSSKMAEGQNKGAEDKCYRNITLTLQRVAIGTDYLILNGETLKSTTTHHVHLLNFTEWNNFELYLDHDRLSCTNI